MSASQHHRQLWLAQHAHRMRIAPSEPERVLWLALRAGQLGVQFRRQVVVQGYIVDFFAPAARLVVEVDGRNMRGGAGRMRGGTGRFRRRGFVLGAALPSQLGRDSDRTDIRQRHPEHRDNSALAEAV
jgi:very-short-patch-repair endonuclease